MQGQATDTTTYSRLLPLEDVARPAAGGLVLDDEPRRAVVVAVRGAPELAEGRLADAAAEGRAPRHDLGHEGREERRRAERQGTHGDRGDGLAAPTPRKVEQFAAVLETHHGPDRCARAKFAGPAHVRLFADDPDRYARELAGLFAGFAGEARVP